MKILALSRYSRLGASSRMRIYQYVPILEKLGIQVEVSALLNEEYLRRINAHLRINWFELSRDYFRQAFKLLSAKNFDFLWIEKELFPNLPAWFEQALGFLNIPYIVDYDDAIFHNYDLNQQPFKRFLIDKIDKVMRGSSLVVCGNEYLAERAHIAGARRVEVIPTVIDLKRYEVLSTVKRGSIVVGWIGSPSTVKYLDVVAPALKALIAEFRVQLLVIGAQFAWPGLDVDCRPWSENSEVKEIQDIDIGIMPLIDSPWERGKCGYKLIQYMACGKPVVASPVGVNTEIVGHSINGYLASTVDEWERAFRTLFLSSQIRLDMGGQGRRVVEERYCIQVIAPRLAKLFHEVAIKGAH